MCQKGLLRYALNSQNKLVSIEDVAKGLACECHCPACNEKLVAKNCGTKRIHHFSHASGADCKGAYETMLHQLAKTKVQEAFLSKAIFNVKFEYRSYCPNINSCGFVRYDNCLIFTIIDVICTFHCCTIFGVFHCFICIKSNDTIVFMIKINSFTP